MSEKKHKDIGSLICCTIGAGVWWFLGSQPSRFAVTLAAISLGFLFLSYCLLAILLPQAEPEPVRDSFVPLPQNDVERPKVLSHW